MLNAYKLCRFIPFEFTSKIFNIYLFYLISVFLIKYKNYSFDLNLCVFLKLLVCMLVLLDAEKIIVIRLKI